MGSSKLPKAFRYLRIAMHLVIIQLSLMNLMKLVKLLVLSVLQFYFLHSNLECYSAARLLRMQLMAIILTFKEDEEWLRGFIDGLNDILILGPYSVKYADGHVAGLNSRLRKLTKEMI